MSDIQGTIEVIWTKYDKDGNGSLEGSEAKAFVTELCKCSDLKG